MNCVDTRGGPMVSLATAIASGLAPSGGLYVPEHLPQINLDDFNHAGSLAEVAEQALMPFFAGDKLAPYLPVICQQALNFDTVMRPLAAPHTQVLELFHGPTAAFKDFGARFLAACLTRLSSTDPRPITILVATSGDTGAAVAAAFHRQTNVRVVILYPEGRVAARQAHQLGCFGDNIATYRVQGSFDDCQRLVKTALNDEELRQRLRLSSANSISLGRLLPQLTYYAHAALQHWRQHRRKLSFVVPTGNLGNALAAVMARGIGFPIGQIVFATNANPVLSEYFHGADYNPKDSIATLANAMDVGAPSNFERLRWLHQGDQQLRAAFHAQAISDEEIRATIQQGQQRYGEIWCPHTATAVKVLEQIREPRDETDWAIVATAHPAKFDDVVEPLIGQEIEVPPALQAMLSRPAHATPIDADDKVFKECLMGVV